MKKAYWASAALFAAASITASHGQSADALIRKLVDKGILTREEAAELREEAAAEEAEAASAAKTILPDWVDSLKIGGDVRLRFDHIDTGHSGFTERNRFRYRLRYGVVATLRENFEAGFRLISGQDQNGLGGDPISGNSTFQDNASKKYVFIDQAYAKWRFLDSPDWEGAFTAGKMANPFEFSSLVFDSDYTPEGFAQSFAFNLAKTHTLGLSLGQFALDEISGSGRDPFLFGAQLRLESEWTERISTAFGISGLMITSEEQLRETPALALRVQPVDAAGNPAGAPVTITTAEAGSAVPNSNSGNTRVNGVLTDDYNPVIAAAEATYKLDGFWGYDGAFPIRFGGEFMHNPGADDHNEGYTLALTFGKAGKRGQWEAGYRWKHLQADAWYEEVVDSDFGALFPGARFRSGTNVEGHILRAAYSPFDSFTLGLSYFLTERITGVTPDLDESMRRLLIDAAWKF